PPMGLLLLQVVIAAPFFVLLPIENAYVDDMPTGVWGAYLFEPMGLKNVSQWNQTPSLHVTYALTVATVLGRRWGGWWWVLGFAWAIPVSITTMLVHEHHLICVVGGLLLFVGLSFMVEWVVDAYRRLGRADYSVVIIILLTVGSVGYLEGIAVGMTAALVLFVINYSRINVVKQALNGALQQSNVDRPEAMRRVIKKEGEHTIIFKLQGFIFFGTANGLLDRIKADIENEKRPKPRFIILDFRAVTGFDSSAAISFVKLSQLAERVGFDVILSGISEGALRALRREGVDDNHHRVHIQPDLDRALEFTEDNILSSHGLEDAELLTGFQNLVNDTRLSEQEAERLLAQMDRLALGADDEFIVQGTHSDALYFLEEGQVSVNLKLPDGRVIRLRTTGAGTIIGEMGLYLNQPRTASVITDEPCVVLRMRSDDLARLETKEPAIAAAFHRYMTKLIAERLGQTNQVLERVL
ncbi:MAG: cyclic nucleotide-binding domain-containing protein, partial [Gammaproteobacteria bacterium]